MNLFQLGDFTLSSGFKSDFKIDCDALSDGDIQTLATLIARLVEPFSVVEGIPRGGLRLAEALRPFRSFQPEDRGKLLLVDDVLTTGGSMERMRTQRKDEYSRPIRGAVIFTRTLPPWWVIPVFRVSLGLWLEYQEGAK